MLQAQVYSEKDIVNGIEGKWELVYHGDSFSIDTSCLVSKVVVELKKKQGKEFGVFKKTKDSTKQNISWKFIPSEKDGLLRIEFKGGFWLADQDFYITKMTSEKIVMLSCDKYDCNECYLIKSK